MCSYPTHLKEGYKSYKLNTPLSPPVKYFLQTVPGQYFFCGYLCFFCVVFITLSRLSIAALWLPAGKGLTSWLLLVVLNCVLVISPCGILGQVWYLILSIPDLWPLSYFEILIRY